ncbi:hypothetical protein [Bradyrhizobium sp. McL0616]|uniref:ATP-dependent DNA ligase n=1 Tax=Bradyrhizobium sp. McL0616 TaxID=3415674 RepID=UPI003CF6FB9A
MITEAMIRTGKTDRRPYGRDAVCWLSHGLRAGWSDLHRADQPPLHFAEAALKIRKTQFVLDGEAVVLGVDGVSDFNAPQLRRHDHEVQLYAFDCLALGGDDLSRLPLFMRKTNLAQLLRGRPEGIFVAPFEQGEIGPGLFDAACRMGLEGLVSKHRERAYRPGRCDHWVKVKNRKHPAFSRVKDQFSA